MERYKPVTELAEYVAKTEQLHGSWRQEVEQLIQKLESHPRWKRRS
jgi:hypothetical protein